MRARLLAWAFWTVAVLGTALWWPLSYRYGAGLIVTLPAPRGEEPGVAVLTGMGKAVAYLSWSSRFSRTGAYVERVLPHEFPHPWFGYQLEGGRLWISLPLAVLPALASAGAAWHLRSARTE